MSFIDKIRYGNISLEYKNLAEKQDKISRRLIKLGLYDRLFEMPFPENSSKTTQEELKSCVRLIAIASDVVLNFCQQAEQDHCQLFLNYLDRNGIKDISREMLTETISRLDPINFRLKQFYNRPRPYQLADYYNLNLHVPIKTTGVDNPAYPSGHALEGYVISELLAARYPEHNVALRKLGKNIGLSRIIIGVHYKSDYQFGRFVGKIIVQNKLISL